MLVQVLKLREAIRKPVGGGLTAPMRALLLSLADGKHEIDDDRELLEFIELICDDDEGLEGSGPD